MATLPSDSRQPPDGHEFPDFIENNNETVKHTAHNQSRANTFSSAEYTKVSQNNNMVDFPGRTKPSNLIFCQTVSASNSDLRSKMYDSTEDLNYSRSTPEPGALHTRSQSLIDMSAFSKQKKWNLMIEQRRKGLSKLKGLVIPEASESDVLPAVNIPEIKSQNTATLLPVPKIDTTVSTQFFSPNHTDILKCSIIIPPWPSNSTNNLPKYSPAFKRRSLQVYPMSVNKNENCDADFIKYCDKSSSKINKLSDDDLNPPKSLESISSPTRSDCSFDYVSSTKKYIKDSNDSFQKPHINKLEDESDNDSAVSSSQSSYNSRFSPPPSPTRSCDLNIFKDDEKLNSQNRLLKPSSVEAINRKNILASAKCRSGKDLKIGSPVIRRKQEETRNHDMSTENGINVREDAVVERKIWGKVKTTSRLPEENSVKKELINTPITVVSGKDTPLKVPSKNNFVTKLPTVPTKSNLGDAKENNITRESYSSILSRRSTPINVKALKENFENFGSLPPPLPQKVPLCKSQITTKNVRAEIAKTENKIMSNNEAATKKTEQVGVKLQEDNTCKSVEKKEESINVDTNVIVLNLDVLGGSLGITLAGGSDENKDITVHRIRYGSVAYHDGRLKRGDKIISVNCKNTTGLTHAEAVELLKEPVTEFSIEIPKGTEIVPSTTSTLQRRSSSMSVLSENNSTTSEASMKKATHVISFVKDGSGLGFSIEGGKDSPRGDVPLLVKKVFTGGAADKSSQLKVGDEILFINDISFSNLSRIEAWTLMKKIPDGNVNIHIFR